MTHDDNTASAIMSTNTTPMNGEPVPDIMPRLDRINRTMKQFCRVVEIPAIPLARILAGTLAPRPGQIERMKRVLALWEREYEARP